MPVALRDSGLVCCRVESAAPRSGPRGRPESASLAATFAAVIVLRQELDMRYARANS
jgi:hypothetical protein